MAVTREEVLKIAELAKLCFEESELAAFTSQFQRILDYVEKLREVDVEGIEATNHMIVSENSEKSLFRDDLVRPSLAAGDALSNAPDAGDGHFKVPKVI